MKSLLIFGRQPQLGLAEAESLYGSKKVTPVGAKTAIIDIDPCLLNFDRLGGSVKFCRVLTVLDTVDWRKIEKFLLQTASAQSKNMPSGKMLLGLSQIGLNVSAKKLEATGLTLKKSIRKTGRPVRLVPNKRTELTSAQILHNKLTTQNGWDLIFIRDGQDTIIAQTIKVQDIESYTLRDRQRPKRDSKVGMLPPKLAQIIINLASEKLSINGKDSICNILAGKAIPRPVLNKTVLDPFCGTGVVLQEALLMGYAVSGTDLDPRMVSYSQKNLEWLAKLYDSKHTLHELRTGDATIHAWNKPIDLVACESYLGRPFTSTPDRETLERTISECNTIIKKFLRNIHRQLLPGTRLCIAIPAWFQSKSSSKPRLLPLLDQIEGLGYNQVRFEHVLDDDLIYHREDQIVGRQLLVITRK